MNSPASPTPRGRGRGRQKEMSSSERVTHWVNQREAKRLNKERWANRGVEDNSSTGSEQHEDDAQALFRQELETEFGSDRSKGKRQDVRLYVPPSLRLKKESETVKDSPDFSVESEVSRRAENEEVCQKSQAGSSTVGSSNKSECEDQQQTQFEASRPKGRGRGRKKPEVEIYVPRALRAAKHDSITAGTQGIDVHNSLCIDSQEKSESIDCDSSVNTNILAVQSSLQSPVFSEDLPTDISHGNALYQKLHSYSKSEPGVPYDTCDSQPTSPQDSATKKVKYELTDSSLPSASAASSSCITDDDALSAENSNIESAENSLTFEFYDPAVIAFLPSSQYSEKSYNTNTSYSVENSGQPSQSSSLLQQDVAICSVPLVSTNCHHGHDEYQSHSSVQNNAEYNLPSTIEEPEEESSHEKVYHPDSGLNQNDKQFKNEQTSVTDSYESKNGEEIKQTEMLDAFLKPGMTIPNVLMSEYKEDLVLSEDLKDMVYNNSACTQEPFEQSSQKDISSTEQLAIQASHKDISSTEQLAIQASHNDISSTEQLAIQPSQKDISSTEQLAIQPSQKDISSTEQLAMQATEEQIVLAGQASSLLLSSEVNKIDMSEIDKASHDHVEDEDDTWDTMFDDNGDCLDSTLVEELTEYVGKVEIDKPKINYLNYEPKEPELDLHAFSHILEIYDFSPELATCDIITAFREFSSRGFDVKWVDDTHALGIFSSAIAANEALRMMHPLLKVRPISEASKKGQAKARHCQEFLQPYKARPETTSIAARRLVAGALGMSAQVSKEMREQERQKLKEAKEKRRQERQQKVDVWDGSYGNCAMDEKNPGLC